MSFINLHIHKYYPHYFSSNKALRVKRNQLDIRIERGERYKDTLM